MITHGSRVTKRYYCNEHKDFALDVVDGTLGAGARTLLRATVLGQ